MTLIYRGTFERKKCMYTQQEMVLAWKKKDIVSLLLSFIYLFIKENVAINTITNIKLILFS